jgi:hypothetical protein
LIHVFVIASPKGAAISYQPSYFNIDIPKQYFLSPPGPPGERIEVRGLSGASTLTPALSRQRQEREFRVGTIMRLLISKIDCFVGELLAMATPGKFGVFTIEIHQRGCDG